MDGLVSAASSAQQTGSRAWTLVRPWLPYGLLALLVLLVLATVSPHVQPLPSTDSSVFLYTADTILDGGLPYRDVWDHKGPLIYYIDALGLLLGDGSRWGVWLLELVFVVGAAWLGYRLLREVFGHYPALFASVIWVVNLAWVLDRGNLTEEYGLLFQFGALWFFWRALRDEDQRNYWGVGLMAALAFLLRPNLVGISGGILLYLVLRLLGQRNVANQQPLRLAAGGFLIPIALFGVYFGLNGILFDVWDQVFYFNFIYTDTSWYNRGEMVLYALEQLALPGMLGLVAWIHTLATRRSGEAPAGQRGQFMSAALWILPLDLLLVSLSGYQYPHYLMTLLPIFTVFSAALLRTLLSALPEMQQRVIAYSLVAAFLLVPLNGMWPALRSTLRSAWDNGGVPVVDVSTEQGLTQVLTYLHEHRDPDEPVLFLGNHVTLVWFGEYPSPTRFVYQAPFLNERYLRPEIADEFLQDLQDSQTLVIDVLGSYAFRNDIEDNLNDVPELLRPIYQYLQDHYKQVEELSLTGWRVYEFVGKK